MRVNVFVVICASMAPTVLDACERAYFYLCQRGSSKVNARECV